MSLTCRIIPCLDVTDGRVVKGRKFVDLTDAGDPVALAKFYDQESADELVFLDITATHQDRDPMIEIISSVADQVFLPLTVGGGIKSIERITQLLRHGADKVSLNSAALKDPDLISQAARKFGSQCIVLAVDVKRGDTSHHVYTHGGRYDTGQEALSWINECWRRGAGEILLTSMDQDGTKEGYDCELLAEVTNMVDIPVIASGGAGKLSHFRDAWQAGAHAVLAASLFHFKTTSIGALKTYLIDEGVPIRVSENQAKQ